MRIKCKTIFCLILILGSDVFCEVRFFLLDDADSSFFSTTTPEFRNFLYTGHQNGKVTNRGNFGLEFPAAALHYGNARYVSAGIAANLHLVMFPKNLKFAVDNFYATLALFIDGMAADYFLWRFYPIYHVSGHLADGAANDSALVHARSVSSEMVRVEGTLLPIQSLAVSVGYGFFYHVCSQQGQTDRFDLSVRYTPIVSSWLHPYVIASGQCISRRGWSAGFDIEAGTEFVAVQKRAIAVALRFFNRVHPGYYFDGRDKSAGIQVTFYP